MSVADDVRTCVETCVETYKVTQFVVCASGGFKKRAKYLSGWKQRWFAVCPPGFLFFFEKESHFDKFTRVKLRPEKYKNEQFLAALEDLVKDSCSVLSANMMVILRNFKGEPHVLAVDLCGALPPSAVATASDLKSLAMMNSPSGEARRLHFAFDTAVAAQQLREDIKAIQSWDYRQHLPKELQAEAEASAARSPLSSNGSSASALNISATSSLPTPKSLRSDSLASTDLDYEFDELTESPKLKKKRRSLKKRLQKKNRQTLLRSSMRDVSEPRESVSPAVPNTAIVPLSLELVGVDSGSDAESDAVRSPSRRSSTRKRGAPPQRSSVVASAKLPLDDDDSDELSRQRSSVSSSRRHRRSSSASAAKSRKSASKRKSPAAPAAAGTGGNSRRASARVSSSSRQSAERSGSVSKRSPRKQSSIRRKKGRPSVDVDPDANYSDPTVGSPQARQALLDRVQGSLSPRGARSSVSHSQTVSGASASTSPIHRVVSALRKSNSPRAASGSVSLRRSLTTVVDSINDSTRSRARSLEVSSPQQSARKHQHAATLSRVSSSRLTRVRSSISIEGRRSHSHSHSRSQTSVDPSIFNRLRRSPSSPPPSANAKRMPSEQIAEFQRARSLSMDSNNSDHSIASSIQDDRDRDRTSPKATAAAADEAAVGASAGGRRGNGGLVSLAEADASVVSRAAARGSVPAGHSLFPTEPRPRFGSLSSNASNVSTSSTQSRRKRAVLRKKYHTTRVLPLSRQRSSSSSTLMAAFSPPAASTMKRGLFGKELKKKNSFSASRSAMSTQSDTQYMHAIAAAEAASRTSNSLAAPDGPQRKGSHMKNTLKRLSRRASGYALTSNEGIGDIKLKSTKGAGTLEKDVYVTLDRHHLSYGLSQFHILKEGSFKKRGNRKVATSWKRRYFCIVPPGVLFYFDSLAHLDRFKKFQINEDTYRDTTQVMTLLTCFLSSVPFYDSSLSQLTVLHQYKGERHVLLVRVGNKSDSADGGGSGSGGGADNPRGKNLSVSRSGSGGAAASTSLKDELRAFYFAMGSNEDAFLLREAIVEAPKMGKRLARRHRATTKSTRSGSLSPSLSKTDDEDELKPFLTVAADSDAAELDDAAAPRLRRVSTLPVANDHHASIQPTSTSFDTGGARDRNVSLHVMTASGPRVYHSDSDSGSHGESPMKNLPRRKVTGFQTAEERKAFIRACVENSSEDSDINEQKSEQSESNTTSKHTESNESSATSTSRPLPSMSRPQSSTSPLSSMSKSRDGSFSRSSAANVGGGLQRTASSVRVKSSAGTPPVLVTRAFDDTIRQGPPKVNRNSKSVRTDRTEKDVGNNRLQPEPKASTKGHRSLSTASDQSISKFSTLSNHSPKQGPISIPTFTNKSSPQREFGGTAPRRKKSANKYAPSRLFNFRRGSANIDDIDDDNFPAVGDANLIGKSKTPPPPENLQLSKVRAKSAAPRGSGPASYLFAKSAPGTPHRSQPMAKTGGEDNAARRLRDKQEAKDTAADGGGAYIRDDARVPVVPSQSSGAAAATTRSRVDEVVQFSGGSGTTDRDIRDCIRAHVHRFQLNKFEILTSGSFRKRGRFMAGWRTRIYALVPPGYLFYFDNIRELDSFRNIMLSRDLFKSSERREHLRKHILGSCPLVEPPQEMRVLPGSYKGAKQVLTIKIASGEAHRRFYFSFPDKMAVQRLLGDIKRVRTWGEEHERLHPEVVAAAARAEEDERREEAEERRRRAAADAAAAAGVSTELRGSGTIGRLRGLGMASRASKSRSPLPKPAAASSSTQTLEKTSAAAAASTSTSALTAAAAERGNVSPRAKAKEDAEKAEREAKAALINKFEHLRSATLTKKMLQRVQTRLAARTSEAKEAEQKTTGVVTPQPQYRTHEESEEAAMLAQLEKLSKEYTSLTNLARQRRARQAKPDSNSLGFNSLPATRARSDAADIGAMSDSDDDEPTLKITKNGKTVSIASDPVSEALWTTLQTRRPSARKSIYFNTTSAKGVGWNRDQLRADLRAFQASAGGEKDAAGGDKHSQAAKAHIDSILAQRSSALASRTSVFASRASMFGGRRRSIAFTPDAKKKTGLSSVRSHLEKTLNLREGHSLVEEKSKLHISIDDDEASVSRSVSTIVTTPMSPSRVSRMASMSVTSPRALSRVMSFGEESLADVATPSVSLRDDMVDTMSPRGLVQGVVAGKEMPMIAMATGAFSEMAFSSVLDLMQPHAWRVAGFGLQDDDVLAVGNALRESDVYLVVEPVMSDAPAPGEDRFTPNEHQTFASRFEVYYWIGRSVSLEKPAIGAIKAVELAQVLSGRTKLHRELQGEESDDFLALFRGDFRYLPGGSKSALRSMKSARETFVKSLMRVHGDKKGVEVEHVALTKKSLSSEHAFLLDTYDTVFVWFGTKSNWHERCEALQLAHRLKDCRTTAHSPTAFVAVLNEDRAEVLPENTPDMRSERRFQALLNAKVKKHSGSKSEGEKKVFDVFVDNDGEVNADELEDVDFAKLSKNMLRKDRILVFDFASQVFVWCGAESLGEDWPAARELARRLMEKRPKWTHFAFMNERCETPLFTDKFFDWVDVQRPVVPAKPFRRFGKSSPLDSIDFKALHDTRPPSPVADAEETAAAAAGEDKEEAPKDGEEASTLAGVAKPKARSVAEVLRDGELSLRPLTEAFESIPTVSKADAKHKSLGEIALEEEANEELEVDTDQLLVFQMNENELDEVSTDGFFDSDKAYIVVHLYRLLAEDSDDDLSDVDDDKEDSNGDVDDDSDSDFDFGENDIVPKDSDDSSTEEADTASASPATPTTPDPHGDDEDDSDGEDEDDAINIRELRKQQKSLRSASKPLARLNYVERVLSERVRASVYFWKGSDCSYARFFAWKCEFQAEVASYFLNTAPRFEVVHQGREPERMLRLFDEGIIVFKGDTPALPEPRVPRFEPATPGADADAKKPDSDADADANADGKEEAESDEKEEAAASAAASSEKKLVVGEEEKTKSRPLVSDFSDHFCQLFQVHGFDHRSVSAVQVECVAENLNSADVFVLITPKIAFCWCGKYSNDAVNGQSIGILDKLVGDREIRLVQEREEQKDFWIWFKDAKTDYGAAPNSQTFSRSPRLFACSSHTARFAVKERHVVSQRELDTTRAMVLDAFSTVFVWRGKESPDAVCELAKAFAAQYISSSPSHSSSCPVVTIAEGDESPLFKSYFHGWNNWLQPEFVDPYAPTTKAFEDAGVFGKVVPYKIQPHLTAQIAELERQRASKLSSKLKMFKSRTRGRNSTLNKRKKNKKGSKRTKLRADKTFEGASASPASASTLSVVSPLSPSSKSKREEKVASKIASPSTSTSSAVVSAPRKVDPSVSESGAVTDTPPTSNTSATTDLSPSSTPQTSTSPQKPKEVAVSDSRSPSSGPSSPVAERKANAQSPASNPSPAETPRADSSPLSSPEQLEQKELTAAVEPPSPSSSSSDQQIVVSDLPPVPSPPRGQARTSSQSVATDSESPPTAAADSDSSPIAAVGDSDSSPIAAVGDSDSETASSDGSPTMTASSEGEHVQEVYYEV